MNKFSRNHIYLLVWLSILLYGSLSSPSHLPNLILFKHADKVIHFLMYFGLSFLLVPSLLKDRMSRLNIFLSFFIAVIFGATMEYFQDIMAQNRTASIFDFIFNCIGSLTGIGFFKLIHNSKLEKIFFKS